MPENETENLAAGALAAAMAELRDLAESRADDAITRCDVVVDQLDAQMVNRRHRASSMKALSLAVQNRMPAGRAKTHVSSRLADILTSIEHEGRFDAASRGRTGFSAARA